MCSVSRWSPVIRGHASNNAHSSNLFLSSLSFCSTSSSNLSTPYRSASFLCRTARARSLSSPLSCRPRDLPSWLFLPPLLLLL